MKRLKVALTVALCLILLSSAGIYMFRHLSKSPIYIAVMVPGAQSSLKSTTRAITSIQMYTDEVNANGGVNGSK